MKVLLICGMHRSGTSCIANELANAGVPISDTLLSADEGNVKGYFEDPRIIAIHDQILSSLGSNWMDPAPLPSDWLGHVCSQGFDNLIKSYLDGFGQDLPVLLIKEPRISRLLALWLRVCDQAGHEVAILHVGRNLIEVSDSLWRRNHIPLVHGIQLWARYNLDVVVQGADVSHAILDIRQFIREPDVLAAICEKLEIPIAHAENFGSQTEPDLLNEGPQDIGAWSLSQILSEQILQGSEFSSLENLKAIYDLCGGDMIAVERRHYAVVHSTLWTVVEELKQIKNSQVQ